MEALGELHDGVNPVPEASDTLHFVKHITIAENERVSFRIGPLKKKQQQSLEVMESVRDSTQKLNNADNI